VPVQLGELVQDHRLDDHLQLAVVAAVGICLGVDVAAVVVDHPSVHVTGTPRCVRAGEPDRGQRAIDV